MGIPYLLRGLISSGCAAYPSIFGRFNFRWSVPIASVIDEANWVKGWARKPETNWHEILGNWDWFASWPKRNIVLLEPWTGLVILGIALLVTCLILKRKKDFHIFVTTITLSFLACLFWFLSAPEPRFGYGYLFSFSGVLLGYGVYNLFTNQKINATLLKTSLMIFLLLLFFRSCLSLKQISNTKKIQKIKYAKNITLESNIIYSPKSGDQCFNTPLPCTPYFNKNLKIVFDKNNQFRMFYSKKQ